MLPTGCQYPKNLKKEKMKREILFKAKRVDNSEWIEGFLFCKNAIIPHSATYTQTSMGDIVHGIKEVIPETVCQFNGLTDKNGNKIFEWDKVKVFIQGAWFDTVVVWGVKSHGWSLKCDRTNEKFGTIKYYSLPNSKHIEITGNIHD